MELLDKKIKEYIASISVPDEIKPSRIKQFIEDSGEITAGKFLKKLREMKISGSEFLELLGNSRIGNIEFRRIEENPHLRFDELLQILDGSNLGDEDYRTMLAVATGRRQQSEERKKREEETLRRVSLEEKGYAEETKPTQQTTAEKEITVATPAVEIADDLTSDTVEEPTENIPSPITEEISEEVAPSEKEISEEPSATTEQVAEETPVEEVAEETPVEEVAEETPVPTEEATEEVSVYEEATEVSDEEDAAEEPEYRSDSVGTGTISEESAEKSEAERTAAAEAIIAKIQASIDSSFENEQEKAEEPSYSVNNDNDYTQSNVALSYDEQPDESADISYSEETEKQAEESYSQPEEEQVSTIAENEQADTSDDTDDEFYDDDEEIDPSAKGIGDVLSDLVDDTDEVVETKKSKGFLIAAFVCAALVLCCAGGLKLLRYFEIIPNYVFKIPEIIKQDIVDFPTLLEETKDAQHRVSYTLPDSFVLTDTNKFSASKNAVGESVCLAVTQVESAYHLTGAVLDNGKVGEAFSFSVDMQDISIEYHDGIFIVTGTVGDMTEIRFYDEKTISGGEYTFSYKQSGKCIGNYTDGNAFYIVTENFFNLLDARSDKLTSFIPYFEVNGNTSVVPFDKIVRPEIAARTNYCTVSRLPYDMGATSIKTVLIGDAGGYDITASGLFTCDNVYLNESYRSRVCRIAFDKDLTAYSTDIDGAINPEMLMSSKDSLLAVGMVTENDVNSNAVFKFGTDLSEVPQVLSPIASGNVIDKAICGDTVLTLISAGDKAMQYNINISDLSSAEKGVIATNEKKLSDKLSASVSVSFNDEGKRTGITLTVSGNNTSASVSANVKNGVQSEWDAYLDSTLIGNISDMPYYESADGIILGMPVTFFDGISQVGEYRFYKYKDNALTEIGRISLYDQKFSTVYCGFTSGDKPCILTLWDNKVITADIENIKIISESEIK